AIEKNTNIVTALTEIATKKGVTPAQLCLAWVSSLGPHVVPIPGPSQADRTLENMAAASVSLGELELEEIRSALERNPVSGEWYSIEYGDESQLSLGLKIRRRQKIRR
ncbi:hypothetical protein FRC09_013922, partial [Ceratobasidium sp. 395]